MSNFEVEGRRGERPKKEVIRKRERSVKCENLNGEGDGLEKKKISLRFLRTDCLELLNGKR